MATTTKADEGQISLVRIQRSTIRIPILGITPFIPNKFGEKAREEMRIKRFTDEGQQAKSPRKARNPEQEARDATYWLVPDEVAGIPAVHFAKAMIGAVRSFSGITKSRHSRRIVPIRRSQNAFACGARTGVLRTVSPIAAIVRSTPSE